MAARRHVAIGRGIAHCLQRHRRNADGFFVVVLVAVLAVEEFQPHILQLGFEREFTRRGRRADAVARDHDLPVRRHNHVGGVPGRLRKLPGFGQREVLLAHIAQCKQVVLARLHLQLCRSLVLLVDEVAQVGRVELQCELGLCRIFDLKLEIARVVEHLHVLHLAVVKDHFEGKVLGEMANGIVRILVLQPQMDHQPSPEHMLIRVLAHVQDMVVLDLLKFVLGLARIVEFDRKLVGILAQACKGGLARARCRLFGRLHGVARLAGRDGHLCIWHALAVVPAPNHDLQRRQWVEREGVEPVLTGGDGLGDGCVHLPDRSSIEIHQPSQADPGDMVTRRQPLGNTKAVGVRGRWRTVQLGIHAQNWLASQGLLNMDRCHAGPLARQGVLLDLWRF